MKINWELSAEDCSTLRQLVTKHDTNPEVKRRRERNLSAGKHPITKENFWRAMAQIRLTSLRRSGPKSRVATFNQRKPYPLEYAAVIGSKNRKNYMVKIIGSAGIGFQNRIAEQLSENLLRLERGDWQRTLDQCNRLIEPVSSHTERSIANYIDDLLAGFGPKQARNLLQHLGLTRFEIPIDSRLMKWLKKFQFPAPVSAGLLSDREYYCFILDAIQELCDKAGIEPTVFDAAVFVEMERNQAV